MNTASNKISAIIVDDELNGINNLGFYLGKYCPGIEVIRSATTLSTAAALIRQGDFQIAFLDIEFCKSTMFDLLEEIPEPAFSIVFVTAYDRYAVKAFKVEALDYILKPLSRHDIVQCYQKIQRHFNKKKEEAISPDAASINLPETSRKVILRAREHVFVLQLTDILYLRAMGAYTEVVFSSRERIHTVVISKTLSALEKEYDAPFFFRVHKSYLINLGKVAGIRKKDVPVAEMADRQMIPIAKRRMHSLFACLNKAG